jgi:3-dehydroquinate dehydratase/shikimate dehydrogenase
LPFLYVPFHVERFGDFWLDVVEVGSLEVLGFPLRGLSITAPHKEVALAVAGATSPLAERVGAANTLSRREGVWEAESTDPEGVVEALLARGVDVKGCRAAVVGAGGAGRAAAVGLALSGASVVLVNRNEIRGRRAAQELGLKFQPLDTFSVAGFSLVVHATTLGREPGSKPPFSLDRLDPGAVVLDLVYGREETCLLQEARRQGAVTVDGREVLLHQAKRQFLLMTGHEPPLETMGRALGLEV